MVGIPSLLETAFSGWRHIGATANDDFEKPPAPHAFLPQSLRPQSLLPQSLLNWRPPEFRPHKAPPADLARMVESEIIPRLMLAHQSPKTEAEAEADPGLPLDWEAVEAFTGMALTEDAGALVARVDSLLQAGLEMEAVYVDLLIPTARRLGDYWNADDISFTDVTIALGRLQQVIRTLGLQAPPRHGDQDGAPSALFVSCPQEQHIFGLFIVEDAFRRGGWRTWIETAADEEETLATLRAHWFDVLGLTASGPEMADSVRAAVAAARRASRNPDLLVMVGGRLFDEHPELVARVGADATAASGADALRIADKALRRLPAAS